MGGAAVQDSTCQREGRAATRKAAGPAPAAGAGVAAIASAARELTAAVRQS